MAAPREDPLAYNGWATAAADMEPVLDNKALPGSQGKGLGASRKQPLEIPVDDSYEFECPAESWVCLVEACRLEREESRRDMVSKMLFLAKNSHWTEVLYQNELELLDDEYGGYCGGGEEALTHPECPSPPVSMPCATCGVDTGNEHNFCDRHAE